MTTAKIKNVSGEALIVPWLDGRLVLKDQAVKVPLEQVHAFTQQGDTWEPFNNEAKKAHREGREALEELQALEMAERIAAFDPDHRAQVDDLLGREPQAPEQTPPPDPDPTPDPQPGPDDAPAQPGDDTPTED